MKFPLAVAFIAACFASVVLLFTEANAASSPSSSRGVRTAICSTFGRYCAQALRVSWCESRWNVYARNGQYLGLFQMGYYARSHYGHSWNAWAQARAAYRYFADTHYSWSPWECKP